MAVNFERKCAACGATLGVGQFCEKCGADLKALSFEEDKAKLLHSGPLRSARSSLLWVGGLVALGSLFAFAKSEGEAMVALVIGLGVAVLYAGLWQWSKQQPLGATAAGLGIFVTLQVGSAVMEPATLVQGIIVKIVVLVLLIRGVRAGVVLRSHGVSNL
jgi:hypothetical protein